MLYSLNNATDSAVFSMPNCSPACFNVAFPKRLTSGYVTLISGGQQQRVSIARTLINRPKVIFAYEPTGNLDRETDAKVLSLLREINRENNTTLVMVTHDREVAIRSDRIL